MNMNTYTCVPVAMSCLQALPLYCATSFSGNYSQGEIVRKVLFKLVSWSLQLFDMCDV